MILLKIGFCDHNQQSPATIYYTSLLMNNVGYNYQMVHVISLNLFQLSH
jgi:hypothetical protein